MQQNVQISKLKIQSMIHSQLLIQCLQSLLCCLYTATTVEQGVRNTEWGQCCCDWYVHVYTGQLAAACVCA